MFQCRSVLLVLLVILSIASPELAAKKSHRAYAGVMVGWHQIERPNRLAGALRGAMLGAASTPPPPSGPSGAGDGVSRTAQGVIAAQHAQESARYPTRWFTVCSFHSGHYIVSASMPSSKHPSVKTGDTVRFTIKKRTLYLTDGLGKTFKLKIVGVQRVSTAFVPPTGVGMAYSPETR